jgi:7,8-dihydroneopterin aldolase/epimerase/oxygenase
MGLIHLEDMEFYAFHGCYKEEQTAGNRFMVNLTMETDMNTPSQTDNIEDALNYQVAYQIVKQEININSHLLEHLAKRILDALFTEFAQLELAKVKVSKMNPPMGGAMKCVSVEMEKKK